MEADCLCLGSGHNKLAKEVSDLLDLEFKYKLDVVSIFKIIFPLFIITYIRKDIYIYYYFILVYIYIFFLGYNEMSEFNIQQLLQDGSWVAS